MTANPPDGDPPPKSDENGTSEREVARTLKRYFDPNESVSEDGLRDSLDSAIQGTIVDLTPGEFSITVVVEQESADGEETFRESYTVRQVTEPDGDLGLEWSYLGPAD